MKKALFAIVLVALCLSLCCCKGKEVENETQVEPTTEATPEPPQKTEEEIKAEFLEKYQLEFKTLQLLNTYSDFIGAVHCTVWNSVGVDKVATYIGYVKNQTSDTLICAAFGVSPAGFDKEKVVEYAKKYASYCDEIETTAKQAEEYYKDIKNNYDFDISDLKEYYLESSAYKEFVSELQGSYMSYTQKINDYQASLEKLKKGAELAY